MTWSDVASGTIVAIGGGIASGLAGPSILNNAIGSAGAYLGYQVAGEKGAMIGNIIAAAAADKLNPSYASTTNKQTHKSDYEKVSDYQNQRVKGVTIEQQEISNNVNHHIKNQNKTNC